MKIWGIADTHLAAHQADIMGVYGSIWSNHREKIIENWHAIVNENDSVLIGGDVTWATNLQAALTDVEVLDQLPGKHKFIVKGNHDVWWKSYPEIKKVMPKTMTPLAGNAIKMDEHVICGTMGWLAPNDPYFDGLDMNAYKKELNLLDDALKAAVKLDPQKGLHLLMHFPPFTTQGHKTPFFDLIVKHPVTTCTFGHFHIEEEWKCLPQGNIDGVEFRLISTDYLRHKPYLVWEE